jgi:hypothetical protein
MEGSYALFMRAVGATVKTAAGLNAVPDDFASTMLALRGQRVDGAFKTIIIMRDPGADDLEGLIVFVSTNFAAVHNAFLPFV